MLASMVVDESSKLAGKTTIYFYCKHGDSVKNTFLAMARTLLHQLSLADETLVIYLFEAATKRGEPTLRTIKLAKEVLKTCLKAVEDVHVVIDGLDECEQTEQKHIAQFWVKFVEGNGYACRCALFSQDDQFTRPLLSKLPSIQVEGQLHSTDIQSFCWREAHRIGQKFELTQTETESIATQTWSRAKGMFLFARVVMDNLFDQVSQADLQLEMEPNSFPEELSEA